MRAHVLTLATVSSPHRAANHTRVGHFKGYLAVESRDEVRRGRRGGGAWQGRGPHAAGDAGIRAALSPLRPMRRAPPLSAPIEARAHPQMALMEAVYRYGPVAVSVDAGEVA